MSIPPLAPGLTHDVLHFLGVEAAPPTLPLLDDLIAAYTRAVPWESASRIVRRAAVADTADCPRWPEEFWQGAMERGTGGTCYESNYAFFSLLRALGYDGYLTLNDMNEQIACHSAIVIWLDGGRWLVDAGFPLFAPVPLVVGGEARRRSLFHEYTVRPDDGRRFQVTRSAHPSPYCFTLIDTPIADADYRAATTFDYGPQGLFLNRVIVARVVNGQVWRFYSNEQPFHLQRFEDGQRFDYPIEGDPAAAVAQHFGMDEATVRAALARIVVE